MECASEMETWGAELRKRRWSVRRERESGAAGVPTGAPSGERLSL